MPINATCPACKLAFGLPDAMVGRWINCPNCGTGFAAVAEGPEPTHVDAEPPPAREATYDLDEDPIPSRSRATPIVLLLAAVLGVAGIVLIAAVAMRPSDKHQGAGTASFQDPTDDYDAWSHKELIAYLANHGLTFKAVSTGRRVSGNGPAMYFMFNGMEWVVFDFYFDVGLWRDGAYVQICATAQEAKDYAGTAGDRSFAWHRFLFVGDREILPKIRAMLP